MISSFPAGHKMNFVGDDIPNKMGNGIQSPTRLFCETGGRIFFTKETRSDLPSLEYRPLGGSLVRHSTSGYFSSRETKINFGQISSLL